MKTILHSLCLTDAEIFSDKEEKADEEQQEIGKVMTVAFAIKKKK